MKTQTLIRWSGPLLIVSAILNALSVQLHSINLLLAATSGLLSLMLFVFAVTGVYATQRKQSGGLGLVAFVLNILGATLIAPSNLIDIAEESGVKGVETIHVLYDNAVPHSIANLCFLSGLFLLGLAAMRAGVLSRWAGILLSIGAGLVFVGFLALDHLVVLGFWLIGAALAWLGYTLWSSKGVTESKGA